MARHWIRADDDLGQRTGDITTKRVMTWRPLLSPASAWVQNSCFVTASSESGRGPDRARAWCDGQRAAVAVELVSQPASSAGSGSFSARWASSLARVAYMSTYSCSD